MAGGHLKGAASPHRFCERTEIEDTWLKPADMAVHLNPAGCGAEMMDNQSGGSFLQSILKVGVQMDDLTIAMTAHLLNMAPFY